MKLFRLSVLALSLGLLGAASAALAKDHRNPDGSLSLGVQIEDTGGISMAPGFNPCASQSLAVTTASANARLSACGSVAVVWNVGSSEAFIAIGPTSGQAATTAGVSIPAGTAVAFNVGTAQPYFAAITASSSTTLRIASGIGMPVVAGGSGGGGGGGGGAVTVADGADSTQGAIADAAATAGSTGSISAKLRLLTSQINTLLTNVEGIYNSAGVTLTNGQSVPLQMTAAGLLKVTAPTEAASTASGSTAPSAMALVGCLNQTSFSMPSNGNVAPVQCQGPFNGAVGSAPPTYGVYEAAKASGNLTGLISCDSTAIYDASTSGSTQIVALSAGKTIYICGYTITTGASATNVKLVYGTGTNCVTSPANITPAFQLAANSGVVDHTEKYSGLKTIASNELCINASGAVAVQAIVYYTQF